MAGNPIPLQFQPGIQRDNTRLNANRCIDGEWVRWDSEGKPRKMRGWRTLTTVQGIPRGISQFNTSALTYYHIGTPGSLYQFDVDVAGNASSVIDRSPSGLASSALNVWHMETMFDAISGDVSLIAQALPIGNAIDGTTQREIYIGDVTGSGSLTKITDSGTGTLGDITSDGGFFVLFPYLFTLNSGGLAAWSVANEPTDFSSTGSGEARITGQKLIAGRQTRGASGSAPSGLIWSLDRLIRVSFTGGSTVFAFDEVGATNVLSPACIVEYDGVYFWPGTQRFHTYSGVLRELPNTQNVDFFFDNINLAARGRCFGFANPRWGEIWWCYPRGSATECTHAVIFNVRLGTWYDTPLPNLGRTCAIPPGMGQYPVMGDLRPTGTGSTFYRVLQHEFGVNEVDIGVNNVVRSFFTTPDITLLKGDQPSTKRAHAMLFEPDFEQTGELRMTVLGNANARAADRTLSTRTIADPSDTSPAAQVVRLDDQEGQVRITFESNIIDGNYRMGLPFIHVQPGDESVTS